MDATRLGESLWTAHMERMRTLEQILNRSCTRGESGVLMYLYHISHPMYPGELTEKLGLTTGRIANILRALESDGLIVRTPDVEDKRRVQVRLTPRGEAMAQAQYREAMAFHTRVTARLTPEETRQLLDMLVRVSKLLEEDFSES